jgi:pyridoxamine 5'-phosphate oxidase
MSSQEEIRRRILDRGLNQTNMDPDPFGQFSSWLGDARVAGVLYPSAMSLATVDAQGAPSQRMVMLRDFDAQGLLFYTSLGSHKAEHLAQNSHASALFPWHMLERQVQIRGRATQLSKVEVMKSFATRSKASQLSSWLSQQSAPVSTRGALESKLKEIKAKFARGDISMPAFWGGYRIVPDSFEFWQTGQDQVNDRFVYRRDGEGWQFERVAP